MTGIQCFYCRTRPFSVFLKGRLIVVPVKSDLININRSNVSAIGEIRSIGEFGNPAGMNYLRVVALTGDPRSAGRTVSNGIAGSIMEAGDTDMINRSWNRTVVENSWKDTTRVTG